MEDFTSWFVNILPLLVLVGFWLYMTRKGGRWKNWEALQERQIQLIEQQTEALRETNQLLRRLVTSR